MSAADGNFSRREVMAGAGAMALLGCAGGRLHMEGQAMYGLIGKITAVAGQRSALADALMAGSGAMTGNISYIVAEDAADADALWVTEV